MPSALTYCLNLLKRRLRSRWELEQSMDRRGISPDERRAVLEELEEMGLVDDHKYAEAWIHTRDRLSPRGKMLLRMELLKKGIDKSIVEETLAKRADEAENEEEEQPTEEELARTLLQSKARQYAHLPEEKRNQRLMALLQRRGFSYEVIRRILNT